MKGRALKEYKESLVLSKEQHEVLVGCLLGDASIPRQAGKSGYNVKFEQQISNKDYVDHLYSIYAPFVGTPPKSRFISGGGANDRASIWFRTYRHDIFSFYYSAFYKDGKKVVPDCIEEWLTPRGLAYWFMDDGGKHNNGYKLCTHAFSLAH